MNNQILSAADFRARQDDWRTALCLHVTEHGRALSSKVLRVALALQHYERATGQAQGTCYPRFTTIATRAGIGGKPTTQKSEVSRVMAVLQEIGLVEKLYDGAKGDALSPDGVPATWMLTLPADKAKQIEGLFPSRDDRKPSDRDDRKPSDPGGDTAQPPGGDTTPWVLGDSTQRVLGDIALHTTSVGTSDATSDINPGCANDVSAPPDEVYEDSQSFDDEPDWMTTDPEVKRVSRLTAGQGQKPRKLAYWEECVIASRADEDGIPF